MASKYVSRSIVMADGTRLKNIKAFAEGGVTHAKTVSDMDGQDTCEVTPSITFNFDYVIPKVDAIRDWKQFNGSTFQRAYKDGGPRTTYTNVMLLGEGEERSDNENEVVRNYRFSAEERIL